MATDNLKMNEAVQHYAEMMGLNTDDPQVQKYAVGLAKKIGASAVSRPEPVVAPPRQDKNDRVSLRYVRAVRRYAESQGLDTNDAQVKKYARGLLNIFKDFRERPSAIEELGLLAGQNGAQDIDDEEEEALEAVK